MLCELQFNKKHASFDFLSFSSFTFGIFARFHTPKHKQTVAKTTERQSLTPIACMMLQTGTTKSHAVRNAEPSMTVLEGDHGVAPRAHRHQAHTCWTVRRVAQRLEGRLIPGQPESTGHETEVLLEFPLFGHTSPSATQTKRKAINTHTNTELQHALSILHSEIRDTYLVQG